MQMEGCEEASYTRQHKRRRAFFFAAMRHFRDDQRAAGRQVFYSELDDPANRASLPQKCAARLPSSTLSVSSCSSPSRGCSSAKEAKVSCEHRK